MTELNENRDRREEVVAPNQSASLSGPKIETAEESPQDSIQAPTKDPSVEQEEALTKEGIESRYQERLGRLDTLVLDFFGDRSAWAVMNFDAMGKERDARTSKKNADLSEQEKNARAIAEKYHKVQIERAKALEKIGLTIKSNDEAQEAPSIKGLESMLDEI